MTRKVLYQPPRVDGHRKTDEQVLLSLSKVQTQRRCTHGVYPVVDLDFKFRVTAATGEATKPCASSGKGAE